MYNILRLTVLTVLLLVLDSNSSFASLKCIEVYQSGQERVLRQRGVSIRENIPAFVSTFKPVYEDSNFNIRVFSKHRLQSPFSPAKLKEAAIQDIYDIMKSYKQMGSVFQSFFEVLIEAHPNAVIRMLRGKTKEAMPWVGGDTAMVGVTSLLPGHDLFLGRNEKGEFKENPSILVLTAISPTYHSLQNKFLLAHEMAHLTQNLKSPLGAIWLEAHADFLAFAATGISDIIIPEGLLREITKSDGSAALQTLHKLRSLSDPSVPTAHDILPSLHEYHRNSQVISSTLFEMSQKLSKEKAVELAQWLNGIKGDPQLKDEALQNIDVNATRELIMSQLRYIGSLFRTWIKQSSLSPAERSILLGILEGKFI